MSTRGSGNYASDEGKENARLRKELRDTKDALEILKKGHRHSGKLTQAIFHVARQEERLREEGKRA